jgi:AraC-like DNA-binding protein
MAQADGIDPAISAHGDVPGAGPSRPSPSRLGSRARGAFGRELLGDLEDYIVAHLDEPIEVAALARIAGRSPFHFIRVFARSVGMTPHRYVVHLRLQHAIELVRNGQSSLAEIAVRTGFADQSHLSRWVRRGYGVSLTQLAACTALPPAQLPQPRVARTDMEQRESNERSRIINGPRPVTRSVCIARNE